jgi:hypothetical protein
MNANFIITGSIVAGSGVTLMARIRGNLGELVTIASFTTISYQVSNLTTGLVTATNTLLPANVIFDDLVQDDPRWTLDSSAQMGNDGSYGYNFATTLDGSAFPISTLMPPALPPVTAQQYQVDVVFTPVSGSMFRVPFGALVIPVYL